MKIIFTIILTAIGVLFAIQNFDHVPVYYFTGKPVHIRLIFVMLISGTSGYLIRYIIGINKEEAIKRKYHRIMFRRKKKGTMPRYMDELEDIEV